MRTMEIQAKSILVPSKLPDADYGINPYVGCELACAYCYASFMGRLVDQPVSKWGGYVYAKVNAVALFEEQLSRWPALRRQSSLMLSSVTDPYQGAERRYRLTRGILEVLAREQYPGLVSILTKSPLVLRDLDVLQRLKRVEIGMTVTTTDDQLSRGLELRAPLSSRRLRTLQELHGAGLNTYAFVGPLLPHFRYAEPLLNELFKKLAAVGVSSIFVEHMNLKPYIKERLWPVIETMSCDVQDVYRGANDDVHREVLNGIVSRLVATHGLKLRLNDVIYHQAHGKSRPTPTGKDSLDSLAGQTR